MKDVDEAIERVLTGLRSAETPTGMEVRILRNLEARATASAKTGWSKWFFSPAVPIAGTLVLASALAIVFFLHSTRSHDAMPAPKSQAGDSIASAASKSSGLLSQPLKIVAAQPSLHGHALDPIQSTEPIDDQDALAFSEMLAPSKPAPPLPLTHQEQLLAQVVNKGEPEQLDQLKPEVREKQVEISKAEFRDFFDPPPPVKVNE